MMRACAVEDVPLGEGRAVTLGGRRVALFHTPTGWYALDHACPHAGGPLADGQTDADVLVCPLHLYAYRWVDGVATSGSPAVRVYPVREVDGMVVVDV
jgi:nitrite reductase/ring-hydroxylating ferredoxin subunit